MRPLNPSPEPVEFDVRVRQRGNGWLTDHPGAQSSKYPDYWNEFRSEMQTAFDSHCAYLGHWISSGQIDHFVAKDVDPRLTYEWGNYRWSEQRVNNLKRNREPFLDPFRLQDGWVDIDPVTLRFFVTPALPDSMKEAATSTLLVLNDPELVRARREMADALIRTPSRSDAYPVVSSFFPLLARALLRAGFFEPNHQPNPDTHTNSQLSGR